MKTINVLSVSVVILERSRCLSKELSDQPLRGLLPGQTYLPFTADRVSIRQAERCGEYDVYSVNDSLLPAAHAYPMVPDNSGDLQLNFHGDKVVCTCGYPLVAAALWWIIRLLQKIESLITQMCPGFLADSAPRQGDHGNKGILLLQVDDLVVGSGGEVWIETDPSEAHKLGYHISIHVSLGMKFTYCWGTKS